MANCRTWRSSYRFVLALVQELPRTPQFEPEDIIPEAGPDAFQDALWDVFFTRMSGIQEYGFHAGVENLMWATDQINGALIQFDWQELKKELSVKSSEWTKLIIDHAQAENVFFPDRSSDTEDEADDFEPAP